ncbi:hypothetical protein FSP39_020003 [Pinctada imbricata]|uniref:RING-type E3 ubiquitin transferase n=1 Tax=Pinctada imbricata TaxID=66713 RepID=A0AA89BVC9_PINIB|nr:hypothetical protein FSP39_020003 [Pinctada imbricata]
MGIFSVESSNVTIDSMATRVTKRSSTQQLNFHGGELQMLHQAGTVGRANRGIYRIAHRHSTGDLASMRAGWPLKFHKIHGDNVILSHDDYRAKRGDSFCKAICFSSRPIAVNERVYIRFADTSSSWSGVLRFGFTNIDPGTVRGPDLPRYACPDMTNKPGCWAKALGERYAAQNNVLHYYVTRAGDVMYGINGEDIGLFFTGVATNSPLWTLLDIYGNTIAIEFVNNEPSTLNNRVSAPPPMSPLNNTHSMTDLTQAMTSLQFQRGSHAEVEPNAPLIPIRHHANLNFRPMPWHQLTGKNIRVIDSERTISVRSSDEYCNAYVFSSRPLKCGEKIVIQILGVDRSYVGGLAFGFTAFDPVHVNSEELPDDSDLLLDRKEYWVVNKDVCRAPEIGDELCFHLSLNGEVKYSKNNTKVSTLMHVDKTLPLWVFFDVYGNVQKIRSIGVTTHVPPVPPRPRSTPYTMTVALPPQASPSTTAQAAVEVSPRREPPGMSRSVSVPSARMSEPVSPPPPLPKQLSMTSAESTIDPVADNEANECTVCYERAVNAVLYTCGHMCMCYECAIVVKNNKGALCPICRQHIKDVIKIYRT